MHIHTSLHYNNLLTTTPNTHNHFPEMVSIYCNALNTLVKLLGFKSLCGVLKYNNE